MLARTALINAAMPARPQSPQRDVATVVVFNDHPVFRAGFIWKMDGQSGIEVLADAASLSETFVMTVECGPDAVIADLRISDGGSEGIEAIEALARKFPGTPVVVYSDFYSSSYVRKMEQAGAAAFVLKSAGPQKLVTAVQTAVAERRADAYAGQAAA